MCSSQRFAVGQRSSWISRLVVLEQMSVRRSCGHNLSYGSGYKLPFRWTIVGHR